MKPADEHDDRNRLLEYAADERHEDHEADEGDEQPPAKRPAREIPTGPKPGEPGTQLPLF